MKVDGDVIENVLAKREELEANLRERQIDLMKKISMLEEDAYLNPIFIRENLSIQIYEEFNRQRKTIQEEMIYIQKQQAIIRRIQICFEALPFSLREILEKLCVQQQKWDAVELSRSTISYRKRKAIGQILEWFHSELTDLEIIQKGQGLTLGK